MLNKLVALILFLHPCHCQMKGTNRVEFVAKDAERPEDEFDPEWLSGALEHEFCRRLEPESPAGSNDAGGDAAPGATTESDEPVPESSDLAASSDSTVAGDTAESGDAPDGAAAEPAPVAKPAVAPKKVVKAV